MNRATRSIKVAGVAFDAAAGWNFYPMQDWVVGRPESREGMFIVSMEVRDAVTSPAAHDNRMAAALTITGYALTRPGFDDAREADGARLAGGESFYADDDFIRLWYCHCSAGLVVAWFTCPAPREHEATVEQLLSECERMVRSVEVALPTE